MVIHDIPKLLRNFQDELVWGATWLYKASGENTSLQYLITNANTLGGATTTMNAFSWDNKYAGAQVLIAQVRIANTQIGNRRCSV